MRTLAPFAALALLLALAPVRAQTPDILPPWELERLLREGKPVPPPRDLSGGDPESILERSAVLSGSSAQPVGTNAAFVGDLNGDGRDDIAVSYSVGASALNEVHLHFGGNALSPTPDVTLTNSGVSGFGFEISGAGDLNGDGYADLFVGAFGTTGVAGRGYVYFGRPAWPAVVAAGSANLLLQPSASTSARFGFESDGAGDLNGDGYDDLVVGDYALGAAYVFLGGAAMDATPDLTITGAPGLGYYVAGVRDLNDDGYEDLAVGTSSGGAFVYFGGAAMDATADLNVTMPGATFMRVEGGGDVNGDGVADLLMSSWAFDGGGADAGGVFVAYGGAAMDNAVDVTIPGTQPSADLGWALGALHDIDGDGYADILVGERDYTGTGGVSQGRVLLFRGGPAMDTLPDAIFEGDGASDRLGEFGVAMGGDTDVDGYGEILVSSPNLGPHGQARLFRLGYRGDDVADMRIDRAQSERFGSAAAVIDANNDGYDDIAIGADQDDTGGTNAGAVRIFYGGPAFDATPDMLLHATEDNANFGTSVANVGDVNGDGYDDLVVGAPNAAAGPGRAYLFLGGGAFTGTLTTSAAVALAPGGTNFTSEDFGRVVAGGGDFNGDGFPDIVVGDPFENATGGTPIADIGAAYLFYGGSAPNGSYDVKVSGFFHGTTSDGNNFAGSSVALADFSQDGLADLVIGVPELTLNPGAGNQMTGVGGVFMLPGRPSPAASYSIGVLPRHTGASALDFLGVSMAVVDLNGDGFPDLAVGSYPSSSSLSFYGRVLIFEGEPSFSVENGFDVSSSGQANSEYYSYSLAPGGDINGDGYDDLLVGAYTLSGSDAYVLYGEPDPDGLRDVRLELESGSNRLALAAPDLNGDGLADAVVADGATAAPGATVSRASIFLSTPPALRPGLAPVRDVPADQGGFVHLEWSASGFERNAAEGGVDEYRVYRAAPAGVGGVAWEQIGTVAPAGLTRYGFTAPTVSDQTLAHPGLTSFRVTAVVERDFGETEFYHSLTRAGASIDNLAPGAPDALALDASADGDVALAWTPVTGETNLAGYDVFRSPDEACDASDTLAGAAPGAAAEAFEDDATAFGTDAWFCVAARDVHGNRSPVTAAVSANPAVLAAVKVVLQGAYQAGLPGGALMRTDIEDALPLAQPYAAAPWGYAGAEAIPADDVAPANGRPDLLDAYAVVDWVLVEIRTSPTDPAPTRAAALLLADGTLLDPATASASARVRPAAPGAYHVAVLHRSHLAAMTAFSIGLSGAAPASAYDLSASPVFVYGTNAVAPLGAGLYGLYAGDGDGSGSVLANDRQAVWLPQVGQTGYLAGDFNLSGSVLADDRQTVWAPNVGRQSAVPGASLRAAPVAAER